MGIGNQGWASWEVVARNLPEHADNRIHTDEGARAAGFPAALVAGVTTYAYLTRPVVAAWGEPWLEAGTAEVTLRSPVFAGDSLQCVPEPGHGGNVVVEVRARGERCAAVVVALGPAPVLERRDGEPVKDLVIGLEGEFDHRYGERVGDDLDLYGERALVHPAVWPALANRIVHRRLVDGSWIHTKSQIHHHRAVTSQGTAVVRATVVDRRPHRLGRKNFVDVVILVGDETVATLRHEYLDTLTTPSRTLTRLPRGPSPRAPAPEG